MKAAAASALLSVILEVKGRSHYVAGTTADIWKQEQDRSARLLDARCDLSFVETTSVKQTKRPAVTKANTDVLPSSQAIVPLWQSLSGRESIIVSVAAIVVLTLVIFGQTPNFDFVQWDDNIHVYDNPYLQSYDLREIGHFWCHSYQGLYIPISYTIFALLTLAAHRLPGEAVLTTSGAPLDPHVFHAVNLLLHLVNVVLVFLLVRRLTSKDLPSVLGTLVFAIHPLQVESVAWVSELRGLAAAFFTLTSLHLYLEFEAQSDRGRQFAGWVAYGTSFAAAICAMLSKPSSVIIALLIAALGIFSARRNAKLVVVESLPYGIAGFILVAVTSRVQAVSGSDVTALWQRPFVAGDAMAFYLWKFIAPFGLGVDYGRKPTWVLAHWWAYLEWAVPAAVAAFAFMKRSSSPYLAFSLLIAVAALLPVLGFVPFIFQDKSTTADRYVYIALVGAAIAIAFAIDAVPLRNKGLTLTAAVIWICALCALSYKQTLFWSSSQALLTHALAVNPRSDFAENNLGNVYRDRNQFALAEYHYGRAVALAPGYSLYRENLGVSNFELGDRGQAEQQFREAIDESPRDSLAHCDLGILLLTEGMDQEGVNELIASIDLDPTQDSAIGRLGEYYEKHHDYSAATAVFSSGLRHWPNNEDFLRGLGLSLFYSGHQPLAIAPLEQALALDPNDQIARSVLSSASSTAVP